MAFHEDARELTIALMSMSALLLTILAVVHWQYVCQFTGVYLAIFGLGAAIGFGTLVFFFLIVSTREVGVELSVSNKIIFYLLFVELGFFILGLAGIVLAVIPAGQARISSVPIQSGWSGGT